MEQYEIDKMQFCEEWGVMSREDFFRIFRFDLQEKNIKFKPDSKTGLKMIKQHIRDNYSDQTKCNCKKNEGENTKCGRGSKCSFRLERRECDPSCSEEGLECLNHDITKERNKKVALVPRGGAGFGAASREEILEGQLVYEYIGCIYAQKDNPHRKESVYTAAILPSKEQPEIVVVESFMFGNISRFFSSSHEPNAELRVLKVKNDMRMGIFAIRTIYPKEEVTWFYGPDYHKKGIECCRCCSLEYCPHVHRRLPEFPHFRILTPVEMMDIAKIKRKKKTWRYNPSSTIRPKPKTRLNELCRIMDETTEKRINAVIEALKKSKSFNSGKRKKPGKGMAVKSPQKDTLHVFARDNSISKTSRNVGLRRILRDGQSAKLPSQDSTVENEAFEVVEPPSSSQSRSLLQRRMPGNGKAIKTPPKERTTIINAVSPDEITQSVSNRSLPPRQKPGKGKAIKTPPKESTIINEGSEMVEPQRSSKSRSSLPRRKLGKKYAIKTPPEDTTTKNKGSQIVEPQRSSKSRSSLPRRKLGNKYAIKTPPKESTTKNKGSEMVEPPRSSKSPFSLPRRKLGKGQAIKTPPEDTTTKNEGSEIVDPPRSSKSRSSLPRRKLGKKYAIKTPPKESATKIETLSVVKSQNPLKIRPSLSRAKPANENAITTVRIEASSVVDKIPVITLSDSPDPSSNVDSLEVDKTKDMSFAAEPCTSHSITILSREIALSKENAKSNTLQIPLTKTKSPDCETSDSSSSSDSENKSTESFQSTLRERKSSALTPTKARRKLTFIPTKRGRRNVGPPMKSAFAPTKKQLNSQDNERNQIALRSSSNLSAMQRLSLLVSEKNEKIRYSKKMNYNLRRSSSILRPSTSTTNIRSTKKKAPLLPKRAARMQAKVCTLSSSEDEENVSNTDASNWIEHEIKLVVDPVFYKSQDRQHMSAADRIPNPDPSMTRRRHLNAEWTCKYCRKKFRFLKSYRQHLLAHKKQKEFKCDKTDCEMSFYNVHKLRRHQETHKLSEDRTKYRCRDCNADFVRSDHCMRHMRKDTNSCRDRRFKIIYSDGSWEYGTNKPSSDNSSPDRDGTRIPIPQKKTVKLAKSGRNYVRVADREAIKKDQNDEEEDNDEDSDTD